METTIHSSLHTCSYCHRELPIENFYAFKLSGRIDNYCKVCRKEYSHQHRQPNQCTQYATTKRHSYPVITEVEDPILRKALLQNALETVAASVARKQNKDKQRGLWAE